MRPRDRKLLEGVVFDVDGVLVDTRRSYLEAIRITTERCLTELLGLKPGGGPLLSLEDVERFKMLGGFNNDWDCVKGLLLYALSRLPASDKSGLEGLSIKEAAKEMDIRGLLASRAGNFLRGKMRDRRVSRRRIIEVFQGLYLGKELYERTSGKKCPGGAPEGLYRKEKLILSPAFFARLQKKGLKLGIATGRVCFEADMVLRRFGLARFFKSVVTASVIEREEKRTGRRLSKPHPFSLRESARRLGVRRIAYVGDIPDDMIAARRANRPGLEVRGIGLLAGVREKQLMLRELSRAGAERVVRSERELETLLGNWA